MIFFLKVVSNVFLQVEEGPYNREAIGNGNWYEVGDTL